MSTIVALNMLNGMYNSSINNNKKLLPLENAIKLGIQGRKSDLSFSYLEYSKFLTKLEITSILLP
jgi:hypothetical protein